MAYNAIFESIFSTLATDTSLIPGLLGQPNATNMRIYRAWPQFQTMLTTYEPNQPSEGWLVIEESDYGLRAASEQYRTNHELAAIQFHVYGTTYTLTHDVLDVLDAYFHWEIDQQRDISFGDRFLVYTRRFLQVDKYHDQAKMFEKDILYRMEMVRKESLYP